MLTTGDRLSAAADSLIGLAAAGSAPNGLEPVLAEGGEVDREVDGVRQAFG
jgi:hypothetical protein